MAVKTSLKTVGRMIGDAVRSFATTEGWVGDDVSVAATIDENTDCIYLDVGTVRPVDEVRWHAGVKKAIRRAFDEKSSLAPRVVIVVRNVAKLEQVVDEMIVCDDEIDITDLLNPPGQN